MCGSVSRVRRKRARAPWRRRRPPGPGPSGGHGAGRTRYAGRQRLPADHDAQRDADQVGVLELHARPLVAVVQSTSMPAPGELVVQLLGGASPTRASVTFTGDDEHLVGRQRHRPDDAVLVVVLLDGRGDDPVDADAVAAHDDRVLLRRLVEELALQRLGVLVPSLKTWPTSMACADRQRRCRTAGRDRRRRAVRRSANAVDLEVAAQVARPSGGCRPGWRRSDRRWPVLRRRGRPRCGSRRSCPPARRIRPAPRSPPGSPRARPARARAFSAPAILPSLAS